MFHREMRLVLGLGVAMAAVCAGGVAKADQKIAIVNIQRAIEDTAEGKAAIGTLKGEVDRKQKEIEAKKEELKKLDEELAKQEAVLKPEALQKKKQELQQKFGALQEAAMRAQRELAEKEMKITGPLQEKVLRADMVLWPQQSEMDITNEVIRKANEIKGGAAPAAGGK